MIVLVKYEKTKKSLLTFLFLQVKYIVPILTEAYISKFNYLNSNLSEPSTLGSKYLRYIYRLFRNEYLKNDCTNSRVR